MRLINPLTLALPLLASAQSYPQLQSVFSKIKSYIPSGATTTTPEAAAEAARKNVIPLTLDNWQETLAASSVRAAGREWYVLVTGGSKTCAGSCNVVEEAWNKSTVAISTGPSPPLLAVLDCETQPVLCGAWVATAPSVWHIVPSKDHTTIRVIGLNRTSTNTETFFKLHKEKEWRKVTPYTGIFHRFDGLISKLHSSRPMGYMLWAVSNIPSWAVMVGISLGSRMFFRARRMGRQPADGPTPPAAAN